MKHTKKMRKDDLYEDRKNVAEKNSKKKKAKLEPIEKIKSNKKKFLDDLYDDQEE